MKKILSFMLVLAMLAMMCINVSAANLVGTRGGNNGIDNGIEAANDWAHNQNEHDVKANVTNTHAKRYAVDLEYSTETISITNDAVWDVDALAYDGKTTITYTDHDYTFGSTTDFTTTNEGTIEDVGTFTVTNYSNAGINVKAEVNSTYEKISGVVGNTTFTLTDGTGAEILGVTPTYNPTQTPASAVSDVYTIDIACSDWVATFAAMSNQQDLVIATVTIIVAPSTLNAEATTVAAPNAPVGP